MGKMLLHCEITENFGERGMAPGLTLLEPRRGLPKAPVDIPYSSCDDRAGR